jgi:hypothetical protein
MEGFFKIENNIFLNFKNKDLKNLKNKNKK